MADVRVVERQSLLDIAVVKCGGVEAAFELALLNGLGITDTISAATELQLPGVANKSIVSYYVTKGYNPATAITQAGSGTGIGMMGIGYTFVVN